MKAFPRASFTRALGGGSLEDAAAGGAVVAGSSGSARARGPAPSLAASQRLANAQLRHSQAVLAALASAGGAVAAAVACTLCADRSMGALADRAATTFE